MPKITTSLHDTLGIHITILFVSKRLKKKKVLTRQSDTLTK
jgi:hypothetical protein